MEVRRGRDGVRDKGAELVVVELLGVCVWGNYTESVVVVVVVVI